MYNAFYELQREPFHVTPDPEFLFPSPAHKEALAAIIYGIEQRKGFVAITGEVGVGKTTILRSYLDFADRQNLKLIYIYNSDLSYDELITTLLQELDIKERPSSTFQAVTLLHEALIEVYRKNHTVVLIIDEAQNMPVETLESLRMLSNLETVTEKLIQIMLIGQPEFDELLQQHRLRQLRQRIAIHARIGPLNTEDSIAYLEHRLAKVALGTKPVFTKNALKLIAEASEGIPRNLNIISDNALITGYGYQIRPVNTKIVKEVLADRGFNAKPPEAPRESRSRVWLAAGLATAAVVALTVAVLALQPDLFRRGERELAQLRPQAAIERAEPQPASPAPASRSPETRSEESPRPAAPAAPASAEPAAPPPPPRVAANPPPERPQLLDRPALPPQSSQPAPSPETMTERPQLRPHAAAPAPAPQVATPVAPAPQAAPPAPPAPPASASPSAPASRSVEVARKPSQPRDASSPPASADPPAPRTSTAHAPSAPPAVAAAPPLEAPRSGSTETNVASVPPAHTQVAPPAPASSPPTPVTGPAARRTHSPIPLAGPGRPSTPPSPAPSARPIPSIAAAPSPAAAPTPAPAAPVTPPSVMMPSASGSGVAPPPSVDVADASSVARPLASPTPPSTKTVKAVRMGDSLWTMAEEVYGFVNPSILRRVQDANPQIRNVNVLAPGQEVVFPRVQESPFGTTVSESMGAQGRN